MGKKTINVESRSFWKVVYDAPKRAGFMKYTIFDFFWIRFLIYRPNPKAFGHLLKEIGMCDALARKHMAVLILSPSPQTVNKAALKLKSEHVRRITLPYLFSSVINYILWEHVVRKKVKAQERAENGKSKDFRRHCIMQVDRLNSYLCGILEKKIANCQKQEKSIPAKSKKRTFYQAKAKILKKTRSYIKSKLKSLKSWLKKYKVDKLPRVTSLDIYNKEGPYFQRQLFRDDIRCNLPDAINRKARQILNDDFGLKPDEQFMILHARESGYKLRDSNKKHLAYEKKSNARNSNIDKFKPITKELTDRGIRTVRVGDPSMKPFDVEGAIDLAITEHPETELLQTYCFYHCKFYLIGESGIYGASILTKRPTLVVDGTDPLSGMPIRNTDLFLPKHIKSSNTGKSLNALGMLSFDYLSNMRNEKLFEYRENTTEEIMAAVNELLNANGGPISPSEEQQKYHKLMIDSVIKYKSDINYIAKWVYHDGFITDAFLADCVAKTIFHKEEGS